MWTCTLLISYLTDMLKTPPCQSWAWHVQPCIISVIGIGPFIQGRDEHGKCCKKKIRAPFRHHSKWVFPFLEGKGLCAVVGLTGNVKPMVSGEANWRVSDRLTPVNRMVGAGADLLACLIWQLMMLMESVGPWLELIGTDVAKYALESPRIYVSIHHYAQRYFLIYHLQAKMFSLQCVVWQDSRISFLLFLHCINKYIFSIAFKLQSYLSSTDVFIDGFISQILTW